ncbi:unnamed protein product [Cuscuta campestris]|uniref:Transmembrane protein n=1 Tax=Cuscuta campestris TaxID=132261 RepID=A0A484MAJ0_9ASTE|nr:unnamed protein product [Cuscuta campestris]
MHRSSSSSRISEFSPHSSSSSSLLPAYSSPNLRLAFAGDSDELPTYNPRSYLAKKERDRLRSSGNFVHLIPLILFLSVIVLWLFSGQGV